MIKTRELKIFIHAQSSSNFDLLVKMFFKWDLFYESQLPLENHMRTCDYFLQKLVHWSYESYDISET